MFAFRPSLSSTTRKTLKPPPVLWFSTLPPAIARLPTTVRHPAAGFARVFDACPPKRGLTDARLALHDERVRADETRCERAEDAQLLVATDGGGVRHVCFDTR